jgi:iron complex outermembrane receptor protein
LGVTGNASFSSEYFTNDDSFLDYVNPSYTNLVATVRLGQIDGPFSVSLVGINITDEIWVNTAGGRPFLSPTGDDQVYTQNRGRQMFLETAIKF